MDLFERDDFEQLNMRKCRNWQTSKTKDLVINAIVWVQIPSSADINKTLVGTLMEKAFIYKVSKHFNVTG